MRHKKTENAPLSQKEYIGADDNETANVVNDAGVAYTALTSNYINTIAYALASKVQAIKDMLQNSGKTTHSITTYEKMDLINKGVTKNDLEYLKQKSGLGYDQLSQVLDVARATLIAKKGTEKFNQTVSEKIVGLADIYSYGYEVFEDEERFNAWVFKPNQALGGKPPYSLLTNQYGREEVKNIIGRIDYGVYA